MRSSGPFPFVLIAAVSIIFLSACPNPITEDMVTGVRDLSAPTIMVDNPTEYAPYSRLIVIEGRVIDQAEAGRSGRVVSLSYEIISHTAAKPASLAADGSFVIEEANDLRVNVVVLLKATDWNGNVAEHRLPLVFPGNEIPSFASEEASREVTLSWDPVPGSASYTLYIEPSSKAPDPASSPSYSGVSSPFTVSQLKNGSLYSFLLEGDGPDGRKNYSAVLRSVPFSELHLLPRAKPRFDGIELSWRAFPSIPSYTVLRASSTSGPWIDISGPVAGSSYFDASASGGNRFFYAVQPTAYSTVRSEYVEASADVVSARLDAPVASYDAVTFSTRSAYKDGYVFIADYYDGLRVLDARNPALPRQVGFLDLSSPKAIAIDGNYAYLGAVMPDPSDGGTLAPALVIVDISIPESPVVVGSKILGTWASGVQAEDVAVLGNLVFVAGFNKGFMVLDATNKASPQLRISDHDYATLGQNYAVAAQNRSGTRIVAVAGNSASALYTVGGTDAAPTLTRRTSALGSGRDLEFGESGSTVLYMTSGSEVIALQTSTLSSPATLSSISPAGTSVGTDAITVSGSRLFVALNIYGYAVVDAAAPSALRTAMVRGVPGNTEHVAIGGGYAYVSTGQDYPFRIYGANDPSAAILVRTLTDVRTGGRLAAYGGRLYVTEYAIRSGEAMVDWTASAYSLSNPAFPARVGTDIGWYSPYDFSFAGDKIYLASERAGIMQWSLANPDNPNVLEPWYLSTQGGQAWDIVLSGHYALLTTSGSWLNVVDLSRADQSSLTIIAALSTSGVANPSADQEARGLALREPFAFVANERSGVRVLDINNPEFPAALAGYGAPSGTGRTAAVALYGDYALAADSAAGLMIYDAALPRQWSSGGTARVWQQPIANGAYDVAVRGSYAFVAYGAAGLGIWDVTNPLAPVQTGAIAQAGFSPVALCVYGDYLYALDGATKLYVIDLVP